MIELTQCERIMLREIADPRMKRRDVAKTYALAIKSSEFSTIDWSCVNRAIIDRWSLHALEFIKSLAWSALDGTNTA